ncbi:MAG: sigma-70 family RNA polymerase sigma factor [Armatimonadota bacterium]
MVDDSQLAEFAKDGDAAAFDALARRARPWLLGLCLKLVHDASAAEDLAQEALLTAFQKLGQLRDPSRFRPWLGAIALNACRMHLRALASRPEQAIPLEGLPDSPDRDAPPLGVDEALGRLDPASSRLLRLAYVIGLSEAEIADALSLSAAAAKSRLHRARQRLRKEMISAMSDQEKARLGIEAPWTLRRILLVEPEAAIREPVRTALVAAGYEVAVLPTGEAAIEAASQRRGDMLILDKHCIEPNWVEVLTLLQIEQWSRENLPVAVLVDDSQRDRLLAWQAGAFLCLTRPPDSGELVRYVQRTGQIWPDRPYTTEKRYHAP